MTFKIYKKQVAPSTRNARLSSFDEARAGKIVNGRFKLKVPSGTVIDSSAYVRSLAERLDAMTRSRLRDAVGDEMKQVAVKHKTVLPFIIDMIKFVLRFIEQHNPETDLVYFAFDKWNPREKQEEIDSRVEKAEKEPYSASEWEYRPDTWQLVDRKTGLACEDICFNQLVRARTTLFVSVLRHILKMLTERQHWTETRLLPRMTIVFDFGEFNRALKTIDCDALCVETDEQGRAFEVRPWKYGPIMIGEADPQCIAVIRRFREHGDHRSWVVISLDGDLIPLALEEVEAQTYEQSKVSRDKRLTVKMFEACVDRVQSIYLLRALSSTLELTHDENHLLSINIMLQMLHERHPNPCTATHIALCATLNVNDYYVDRLKKQLLDGVGQESLWPAVMGMTLEDIRVFEKDAAAMQRVVGLGWGHKWLGGKGANALADSHINKLEFADIISRVVTKGTASKGATPAYVGKVKQLRTPEAEAAIVSHWELILNVIKYWRFDPTSTLFSTTHVKVRDMHALRLAEVHGETEDEEDEVKTQPMEYELSPVSAPAAVAVAIPAHIVQLHKHIVELLAAHRATSQPT